MAEAKPEVSEQEQKKDEEGETRATAEEDGKAAETGDSKLKPKAEYVSVWEGCVYS